MINLGILDEIDDGVDEEIVTETDQRGPGMAQIAAEKIWDGAAKERKRYRFPVKEACVHSPFAREINEGVNIVSVPVDLCIEVEGDRLRFCGTIENPIPGIIERHTSASAGLETISPEKTFPLVPPVELLPALDPYNTFISRQIGKACKDIDGDGMVVFKLVINESTILVLRTDQPPSTPQQ